MATPSGDILDEVLGCPQCGERNTSKLLFNDYNQIQCQNCGLVFDGDDWAKEYKE